MRYLFVTWDGGGNMYAELALAERLVERGHEVKFLGHRTQRAAIEVRGCAFAPLVRAPDTAPSSSTEALINDWDAGSLPRQFALYRDKLSIGPAALFAADVLAEVERFGPDAIAADCMLAGAHAAAESTGLPAAALWHFVYAPAYVEVPPYGLGLGLPRGLPGRLGFKALRALARRWLRRSLPSFNDARAQLGLAPLSSVLDQFDRLDRVLVMSSAAFDFAALSGVRLPANVRYIGPQTPVSAEADLGAASKDPPLVLVSLSTTFQDQGGLLERVIGALADLPVRAIVTTGPAIHPTGTPPANVEVTEWLPHSEVLPRASAVLTHGGHGTAMASLAHGVPLVCIPIGRDQPDVAARVVHSGAGLRLPKRAGEQRIAAAVLRALEDPALRRNAERLGARIREEIAADRGVAEMEALAELPGERGGSG